MVVAPGRPAAAPIGTRARPRRPFSGRAQTSTDLALYAHGPAPRPTAERESNPASPVKPSARRGSTGRQHRAAAQKTHRRAPADATSVRKRRVFSPKTGGCAANGFTLVCFSRGLRTPRGTKRASHIPSVSPFGSGSASFRQDLARKWATCLGTGLAELGSRRPRRRHRLDHLGQHQRA